MPTLDVRNLWIGVNYVSLSPVLIVRVTARCWWLTPVILAAQEAELRRIAVLKPAWANSL
jgi:hypothetical protein